MNKLTGHVALLLKTSPSTETALTDVLSAVLSHFHSETATLHWLDDEKQLLHLAAQKGLPPQLLDVVKTIPAGKGIAGQVIAQNQPVTICNLQTDSSGVAKPGARQTGVGGALCVPVRREGKMIGTLGIGTVREHQYTPEETALLEEVATAIGMNRQA